ncbi:MAG: hypothetical protein KIS81_00430 [Maricaulaceae bacterium]|nr:hypothetical protein [Maricaulaceae bacterium]
MSNSTSPPRVIHQSGNILNYVKIGPIGGAGLSLFTLGQIKESFGFEIIPLLGVNWEDILNFASYLSSLLYGTYISIVSTITSIPLPVYLKTIMVISAILYGMSRLAGRSVALADGGAGSVSINNRYQNLKYELQYLQNIIRTPFDRITHIKTSWRVTALFDIAAMPIIALAALPGVIIDLLVVSFSFNNIGFTMAKILRWLIDSIVAGFFLIGYIRLVESGLDTLRLQNFEYKNRIDLRFKLFVWQIVFAGFILTPALFFLVAW